MPDPAKSTSAFPRSFNQCVRADDQPLDCASDLLRRVEKVFVVQMCISRGRLVIRMSKQPIDHRQGLLVHRSVTGKGMAQVMNAEPSLSFWIGPDFQIVDLIAYLGTASIATDQLAALDPREWRYSMGYRELAFSSYVLDLANWDRELRAKHGPEIPRGRQEGAD